MAVTTKPRATSKKGKQNIPLTPVLLGMLSILLLAAVVYLLMQDGGADERERQLEMAVIQMAAAAESDVITQEVFEDDAVLSEAIEGLAAAIALQVSENRAAQEALAQQRTTGERAAADLDMAMQQLRDSRNRVTELERALAEARQETAQLRETRESALEELRAEKEELTAQLERARTTVRETAPAAADEIASAPDSEPVAARIEPRKKVPIEPDMPEIEGVMTEMARGQSELFAYMWYDAATEQLLLETRDGKRLLYSEFPEELHEQLQAAPSFDVFFRFRILQNFPSDPDDLKVVRSIRRR